VIVARDAAAADQATAVLRTLGSREDDKTINVTRGDIGSAAVHTVIFVQPPVLPAELQRVAQAKPVQIVAIAAPGEVPWLRELTSGRLSPLNFQGPERRARDREEALREELRAVLARGVPAREVISLEPLLQEFDGAELAAAALNLLERERAQRRAAEVNQPAVARPRPDGDRSRPASSGAMTRLFMTVGTRDGVKVGDLMGSIAGEGGIPGDHVGKIDLRESHALVEVSAEDAASVIARLNGASIKGRRVVVRAERDRDERERAAGPRGRPGRDSGGDRPPRRGPSDRPRAGGSSDRPRSGNRPPRKDRDRS
jgi:ATP-dependent RNA helicase DeaD